MTSTIGDGGTLDSLAPEFCAILDSVNSAVASGSWNAVTA
jgi:hypothetical protein